MSISKFDIPTRSQDRDTVAPSSDYLRFPYPFTTDSSPENVKHYHGDQQDNKYRITWTICTNANAADLEKQKKIITKCILLKDSKHYKGMGDDTLPLER